VGQGRGRRTAPDFSLTDSNGKTQTLSQYKGKIVVLEWNNPECPFVGKHYNSGNMQKQQAEATGGRRRLADDQLGAAGKQGNLDASGANAYVAKVGASRRPICSIQPAPAGHLYGARTTPHIYIIDAQGVLRYMGGIDSIASTDKEDLAKATQFVPQVLTELKAGKAVSVTTSQPYGCSVKYGS
jgi:cytochrome oxidase Cu insertion factor (SCO1/SenC/PrrC family)